jgi:putative CocE/NonD family hydrolase
VRLCDVHPDGRSITVCDGILRARYRDSFERPALLVPGRVYQFAVDLRGTAQTFKVGHRLRVHVTGSDFPRVDRNLNTGGKNASESGGRIATNTVYHDVPRPSHLRLPILSASEDRYVSMRS